MYVIVAAAAFIPLKYSPCSQNVVNFVHSCKVTQVSNGEFKENYPFTFRYICGYQNTACLSTYPF
jgi:hypothetical protein